MKITTKFRKQLKACSLAALAYISIATSTNVIADPAMMDGHPNHCGRHHEMGQEAGMPPPGLPPHLRALNFTSEQEDKVFALIYAEIPQMHAQMKQRKQIMEEMHQLANTDKLDENKLKVVAEKMAALEKESLLKRVRIDSKIFAILTTEQRVKLMNNNKNKLYIPEMMPSLFKDKHQTKHQSQILPM